MTWNKEIRFNFALEYAIRNVHEYQEGMEMSGTHQNLLYDDNVKILAETTNTIRRNTEGLLWATREVGLEKTKRKLSK